MGTDWTQSHQVHAVSDQACTCRCLMQTAWLLFGCKEPIVQRENPVLNTESLDLEWLESFRLNSQPELDYSCTVEGQAQALVGFNLYVIRLLSFGSLAKENLSARLSKVSWLHQKSFFVFFRYLPAVSDDALLVGLCFSWRFYRCLSHRIQPMAAFLEDESHSTCPHSSLKKETKHLARCK